MLYCFSPCGLILLLFSSFDHPKECDRLYYFTVKCSISCHWSSTRSDHQLVGQDPKHVLKVANARVLLYLLIYFRVSCTGVTVAHLSLSMPYFSFMKDILIFVQLMGEM